MKERCLLRLVETDYLEFAAVEAVMESRLRRRFERGVQMIARLEFLLRQSISS